MKTGIRLLCVLVLCSVLLMMASCVVAYKQANELIKAIEENDTLKITALLESGVDPNALAGPSNPVLNAWGGGASKRPLSVACATGNLAIVEILIDHGATAEYQEAGGWSPMAETLFYYQPDDIEIIKLLLANGADIAQEEAGWLPVFHASRMYPKRYDAQKSNGTVFLTDYDVETAEGITEIVKLLMGNFDINDQSKNLTTLLMNAASVGNVALVEYLLSIGADVTLTDYNGKTAYDLALQNGHEDVAILLEKHVDN